MVNLTFPMANSSEATRYVNHDYKMSGESHLDVESEIELQVGHSKEISLRALQINTFNICKSVVLPALSRPRNKSFACLLRRPRDERTSQNHLYSNYYTNAVRTLTVL